MGMKSTSDGNLLTIEKIWEETYLKNYLILIDCS